jgi:hypothetical protein
MLVAKGERCSARSAREITISLFVWTRKRPLTEQFRLRRLLWVEWILLHQALFTCKRPVPRSLKLRVGADLRIACWMAEANAVLLPDH